MLTVGELRRIAGPVWVGADVVCWCGGSCSPYGSRSSPSSVLAWSQSVWHKPRHYFWLLCRMLAARAYVSLRRLGAQQYLRGGVSLCHGTLCRRRHHSLQIQILPCQLQHDISLYRSDRSSFCNSSQFQYLLDQARTYAWNLGDIAFNFFCNLIICRSIPDTNLCLRVV
jgi:hypothetical protein